MNTHRLPDNSITQASSQGNSDRGYLAAYRDTPAPEAEPALSSSVPEADALSGGAGGKAPAGYLDSIANVSSWLDVACENKAWFVPAECANGHRFAKEITCGKEWCGVCGEDGSVAHNRRFARWLPKVQQISGMGYFVFTLPESVRGTYRTKKALGELGHQVQELLKSYGFTRGLRRWHWAGDFAGLIRGREVNLDELRVPYLKAFNGLIKAFAEMDGSNLVLNPNQGTVFWSNPGGKRARVVTRLVANFAKTYRLHLKPYSSIKVNFHLNCLVDGGYISSEVLARVKAAYARLLGVDLADVNYHYRRSPGRMVHTLKYVARATFRDYEWDIDMALELRGFRNMVVWGRGQWDGPPMWSLADLQGKAAAAVEGLDIQAIDALVNKTCPVCGSPMVWGGALPAGLLKMVEKRSLGAGYWRVLPDARPPPGLPDDVERRLYWLECIHRAEVRLAAERVATELATEAEYQERFWRDLLN